MLRIGYRGARATAPENALASFRKALEIGVDAVELDVRKTKDTQIVVIHDEDVKRTTNGTGLVCELTLKEIKGFDAGHGEKIPTLEETLDFLDKRVKVFVELKEQVLKNKCFQSFIRMLWRRMLCWFLFLKTQSKSQGAKRKH